MKLKHVVALSLTVSVLLAGCTINVAPGSGQPIDNSQQAFQPIQPAQPAQPQPQPYAPGTNPIPTPIQPATPPDYQQKDKKDKEKLHHMDDLYACSKGFHNHLCPPTPAPMTPATPAAPAPVVMAPPKPPVTAHAPVTAAAKKDDKKDKKLVGAATN